MSLPVAASAGLVNYADFNDTTGLRLNEMTASDGALHLTTGLNDDRGSTFTKKRKVDPTKTFHTHFVYPAPNCSTPAGEGMTFTVQNDADGASALGNYGSFLGYSGISPSIAVEYDISGGENDPTNNPHIGILENGDTTNHLDYADQTVSGIGAEVWVDYSAKKHQVKAYWSEIGSGKPATPSVATKVNLAQLLGGPSFAGFTGATGGYYCEQDISEWDLQNP